MLGGDGRRAEARLPARRHGPARRSTARSSGCGTLRADSVQLLTAADSPGEDVVAACNALGLFADGGRLIVVDRRRDVEGADAKEIASYLKAPAPATTLALVAGELKKDAPIAKAVAGAGEVLLWDVPKRGLQRWVGEQFQVHGAKIEPEAARVLVELVGEDLYELATEIDKLATWAGTERVGVDDVERLVAARGEATTSRSPTPGGYGTSRESCAPRNRCSSAAAIRTRRRFRGSSQCSAATSRGSGSVRRSRRTACPPKTRQYA
jgi:hypothetical protein